MADKITKKVHRVSNNFMEINYAPKESLTTIADDEEAPNGSISVEHVSNHTLPKPPTSRWSRCCAACNSWCHPCMWKHNPLPTEPGIAQKIRYSFMCPPHGKLARLLTLALVVFFIWGILWGITGDQALPGGNLFALLMLVVWASIGGFIISKIQLPPLLGMLVVGFCLRNIPVINVAKDIEPIWSAEIRNMALGVILIRAGLGLDPVALRRLSCGVMRLAFLPCITEAVCAAVTSHFLLGFPWTYGFMLGFVLGAVSPAVVVPSMLGLHEQGYGVNKGIPTLVIAAASVDDVLAITGFGIVLAAAFSQTSIVLTVFKGPLEAILGLVYGVVTGVLAWYLPHGTHTNKTLCRFLVVTGSGLFAIFGSRMAEVSGAGPLGCLTVAFVAALRWRKEVALGDEMPVSEVYSFMWTLFQPALFGLMGAEISVSTLEAKTVGYGLAVLAIGLVFRALVAFVCVLGLDLNLRERVFIPLAWLPKATVQAAIGSVALDTARILGRPDTEILLGTQILTIAVLSIVVTAPIGAVAIAMTAPCLLQKTPFQHVATVDEEGEEAERLEEPSEGRDEDVKAQEEVGDDAV